jgi:hypothetical protein
VRRGDEISPTLAGEKLTFTNLKVDRSPDGAVLGAREKLVLLHNEQYI